MKIVGVTGGIGAGKSLICEIFSLLGIPVYNSDKKGRYLMDNEPSLKFEIRTAFGELTYTDGKLNRAYLAKEVFSSGDRIRQLNAIVHPAVGRDFETWKREQRTTYVIKESALLIETGLYKSLDVLINVVAPEDLRIERTLKRDPFRSLMEVQEILAKQTSGSQREEYSDHIITNDGKAAVIPQVLTIHESLIAEHWKKKS